MADGARSGGQRAIGIAIAATVFVVDQLTKWIVIERLRLPEIGQVELLPVFDLTWVENRGISMGFLAAGSNVERWGLVALTAAIATVVAVWLARERRRPDAIALGLVLGGAFGNILDRSRFGYVADFLDLHIGSWHPFLVFNVADAAITIGVLLLIVRALFTRDEAPATAERYDDA